MNQQNWHLAIEEVALILSYLGHAEYGVQLLKEQLGDYLTKEHINERLVTAGHTLMSRGLISVDMNGAIQLSEEVSLIGRILVDADISLRFEKSERDAIYAMTYHFLGEHIYQHIIDQGVVHRIDMVRDAATVTQDAVVFFDANEAAQIAADLPLKLSSELFIDAMLEQNIALISKLLDEAGIDNNTRELFLQSLQSPERIQGSMMRVEYNEKKEPIADNGLFIISAPADSWLITVLHSSQSTSIQIDTLTQQTLRAATQLLMDL